MEAADECGYREAIDALRGALGSNRELLTLAAAKAILEIGDLDEDAPWPHNATLPRLASTPEKRAAQLCAELIRAALQADEDEDDG